jgi:hypothetical protein
MYYKLLTYVLIALITGCFIAGMVHYSARVDRVVMASVEDGE